MINNPKYKNTCATYEQAYDKVGMLFWSITLGYLKSLFWIPPSDDDDDDFVTTAPSRRKSDVRRESQSPDEPGTSASIRQADNG